MKDQGAKKTPPKYQAMFDANNSRIQITLDEGQIGSLHSFHEVVLKTSTGTTISILRDPAEDEDLAFRGAVEDALERGDRVAAVLGRKGGVARAKKLSNKRKREIASQGGTARWKKTKCKPKQSRALREAIADSEEAAF